MQAGPPPEDLHAILSRFHNWSGKGPANGNGHAKSAPEEGIREIPYEEAIRQHRNRQAGRSGRRTAHPRRGKPQQDTSQPAAKPAEHILSQPLRVAGRHASLGCESACGARNRAGHGTEGASPCRPGVDGVAPPAAPDPPTAPRRGAKPSPTERATVTKPPKIESSEQVFLAAFPELPASRFVDLPAVPLTQRSKPRRRVAAPPPPAPKQPVAAVQASALKPASAAIAAPPSPKPQAAREPSEGVGSCHRRETCGKTNRTHWPHRFADQSIARIARAPACRKEGSASLRREVKITHAEAASLPPGARQHDPAAESSAGAEGQAGPRPHPPYHHALFTWGRTAHREMRCRARNHGLCLSAAVRAVCRDAEGDSGKSRPACVRKTPQAASAQPRASGFERGSCPPVRWMACAPAQSLPRPAGAVL